jgi:hypothetical protein
VRERQKRCYLDWNGFFSGEEDSVGVEIVNSLRRNANVEDEIPKIYRKSSLRRGVPSWKGNLLPLHHDLSKRAGRYGSAFRVIAVGR